jgi:Uma2 family endonuclease
MVVSASMTERGRPHTIAEWLEQPPERRLELIDGALVEKAAPDTPHSISQAALIGNLYPTFYRKPGGAGPGSGGWWLMTEADVQIGADVYRPDVAGWRWERSPTQPPGRPITLRPDWICEVLSESNRTNDTIRKLRRYHSAGVPHYWILSPAEGTLTVFRHQPEGYATVLSADRAQRVRAEPFEAIELHVGLLLGDVPD